MSRGDWLFIAATIAAFVIVFWALFGSIVWRLLGEVYP